MFLTVKRRKIFLTLCRILKATIESKHFQSIFKMTTKQVEFKLDLSTMLQSKYHINTFTYLKFSLNLTVAAQWNIILVESMMTSLSSSLRASSGWVSSLLIAIIFSLKSGFSSLNLSKSYQRRKPF